MKLRLRELVWMAKARRRDEWGRMAELLALVDARTAFDKDYTPRTALEWVPKVLLTDDDRRRLPGQIKPAKITIQELAALQGVKLA